MYIYKDKFEAAYWGFIVGDAMGVPYEFLPRNNMDQDPATGMIGYGTHRQPPGTWSDDTTMMLCVMENLAMNGGTSELSDLFIKWYSEGYHTANGNVFDMGITTRTAINKLMRGVLPHRSGSNDEYSKGNGSLMRSVPYAFLADMDKSINRMQAEHAITHQQLICQHASIFYINLLRGLAEGMSPIDAYSNAGVQIERFLAESNDLSNSLNDLKRVLDPDFANTLTRNIRSSGYVVHTLEAVVWCFLKTGSFEDAVLKAINLGEDTDTIAALTGGLSAVYYGIDSIPSEWRNQIAKKDELERQFHLFC